MQNPVLAADVDGDSLVTALDALRLVNYLNANPAGGALPASSSASGSYLDVNGDGEVNSVDVLLVANYINGPSQPAAESEASSPPMVKRSSISPDGLRHAERDGYFGEAESGFELEDALNDIAAGVSEGWLD